MNQKVRSIRTNLQPAQGMFQRRCACGNHALSGVCEACAKSGLQRKSMMGSNDPMERQADQVADAIMHTNKLQTISPMARHTDAQALGASPLVNKVLLSSGNALDKATRSFFEPRFGHRFTDVRVHTDGQAADSAHAIGAKAYTAGRHIVFGKSQYAPYSNMGRRLLAHELTHVLQQDQTGIGTIQRFAPEDAAEEMVGKTFLLNADVTVSGKTLAKGSSVVITTWDNNKTTVKADAKSGGKTISVSLEKEFLTPQGDSKSGLYQYHAGVEGVEKKYAGIESKITAQEKVVADWKLEEKKYTTTKGHAEWRRQLDVKETELKDLKYKLTGEGYTASTLPERLKKKVGGKMVPITPQSTLLNKALIEETMFNSFDASVVKWVDFYNKDIGAKKKWSKLDANLVKSMLYQESHMGTQGDFLKLPPYTKGQRMTRFNIGQAIDSSGPQQILMIKEISPAIATKHKLDQVTKDMNAAKDRRDELLKKGSSIKASEQTELDDINAKIDFHPGEKPHWNNFFTSDSRWIAAVEEFFTETVKARNLDYDYWIRTSVRWLFEKRDGVKDWAAAITAYNGSGAKAKKYEKDVEGRRDAAKAGGADFEPKQHY